MPMMSPRHKHLLAPVGEQLDPPTLHDEALQDAVRNALQERPRSLEECAGDGETAAAAGELQRRRSLAALISQTIKDRRIRVFWLIFLPMQSQNMNTFLDYAS